MRMMDRHHMHLHTMSGIWVKGRVRTDGAQATSDAHIKPRNGLGVLEFKLQLCVQFNVADFPQPRARRAP